MDNTLLLAVGKVRLLHPELSLPLQQLMGIALRQRQALKFYASQANYIDGVPHLDMKGTPTQDDGTVARYALGDDYVN